MFRRTETNAAEAERQSQRERVRERTTRMCTLKSHTYSTAIPAYPPPPEMRMNGMNHTHRCLNSRGVCIFVCVCVWYCHYVQSPRMRFVNKNITTCSAKWLCIYAVISFVADVCTFPAYVPAYTCMCVCILVRASARRELYNLLMSRDDCVL